MPVPVPLEVDDGVTSRRVLIADACEIVCAGMRALLDRQPWVGRCVTASDRDTAAELASRLKPHVAVVALDNATTTGITIANAIRERSPYTRVVFMCDGRGASKTAARAAGAYGVIGRDWKLGLVIATIRRVTQGKPILSVPRPRDRGFDLSERERDVLEQLVRGATNPEAAVALDLSPHTVKQHTRAVYRKLGVRNRVEAVSRAHALGLT